MALDAADLRDEIIALFPGIWVWNPSDPNYAFLDALCSGFVSMWNAGVLTPGLGPPPGGSYPHTHTIATLVAATMSAPAVGLGYTAEASQFAVDVASETAAYLITATVMGSGQGEVPHDHAFTTFGTGSALKSAILGVVGVSGVGIDPFLTGFTDGLIAHLGANAAMSMSSGAGHLHTLS